MKQTIIIRVLIFLALVFFVNIKGSSSGISPSVVAKYDKKKPNPVFVLKSGKNLLGATVDNNKNIILDGDNKSFTIVNDSPNAVWIQEVLVNAADSTTITVTENGMSLNIAGVTHSCCFSSVEGGPNEAGGESTGENEAVEAEDNTSKKTPAFSLKNHITFEGGSLKEEGQSYIIELSSSQSLTITNKFSKPITVNNNQLKKGKKISLTNKQISSEITIEGIKIKVVVKQEPSEVKDSPIFLYHKDSWEEIKGGTTYVLDSLRLKYTNKNLKVYRIEANTKDANTKDANTKDKIKVEPKSIEEKENIIFDFSLKEGNLQYSIETEEKAIVFTVNCPPPGGPGKTGGGNNKDVPKSVFENKVTVFIGVLIITLLLLFFVYSIIIKKKRKQTALIQTKKESSFRSQNLMSEEVSEKQSDRSVIERNLLKKLLIGEVPNYLSSDYDELVRKIQLNNKKEENPRPRHIGIEETQLRREVEKLSREKSILNLNCDKYKEQVKNLQGQIGNLERRASESMALQARLEKEISDLKPYNVAIGTFINSLDFAYKQLKQMEAEADKNSIFYPMIREIIDGQGRRISNPLY